MTNKIAIIVKEDKRIADIKSIIDLDSEIREEFAKICSVVSFNLFTKDGKENISESEKLYLIESIKKYYRDLRPKELSLAFEYAAAAKFECNLEHYNGLSFKYIADVLNKYREYKRKLSARNKPEPIAIELSDAEKERLNQEALKTLFQQYKDNKDVFIPSQFHDLIPADDLYPLLVVKGMEERIKDARGALIQFRQTNATGNKMNQLSLTRFESGKAEENEAKRTLVKEYFDKLIETN